MKKITSLLLLYCFVFSTISFAQEEEKSTYFLIRHAEKDRSDAENKNPNLTEKGQQRAVKWSELLADYGINSLYSTQFNRTLQTAKPIAEKLSLTVNTYHPFKLDFEKFLEDTKGKTVLVVGHSNTIPFFTNKLIGADKYQQMEDNDNSSLYVVTVQGEEISHLILKTSN